MDELNHWIQVYLEKHGSYFWFDQQDWEEHGRKQSAELTAEEEHKQRMDRIRPIVELLSTAAGRKLKVGEIRVIDGMDDREVGVFAKLMADVVSAGIDPVKPKGSYGYGHFED
ncbi:hypothetical protein [Cohnella kolymensis]|uniref:hypothetical protein n=1 Tax=Cohnella kolymensis TaxID=1590652 RepID=UPI000ACB0CE3|nr:hypothetical protein [Cohnella kolymensis]